MTYYNFSYVDCSFQCSIRWLVLGEEDLYSKF